MGRTGFAHLFEHMMFKGSENVGPGEHFYTIFSNGGTMNGTTNKERTLYFETMPANQLDAALFLEADRMRSLAIVKDNLDNQRNAVQEERRLRVDNQPYGRADEAIDELAFDNFAYQHSVIGSMAGPERRLRRRRRRVLHDLLRAQQRHHRHRRRREHRVGAGRAREDISSRFRRRRHRRRSTSASRRRTRNAGCTVDDSLARLPRLDIGYRVPSSLSPDDDAVDVLGEILASGRSARFYEHIVREKAARGVGPRVRAEQPRSAAVRHRGHAGTGRIARCSSSRRSIPRSRA